jgi:hypothetical protein
MEEQERGRHMLRVFLCLESERASERANERPTGKEREGRRERERERECVCVRERHN